MNRVIKFRAWDKEMKWVRPVAFLDLETGEAWMRGIVGQNGHAGKTKLLGEEYELMQFTNLLDKNGKEIYEGDVVRTENEALAYEDDKMVVHYTGAGFMLSNPNCCNACSNGAAGICPLDEFDGLEVIGNIYENGDVLAPKAE